MRPGTIKNANMRLAAPPGMANCDPLLVHHCAIDCTYTSLWVPSLAELSALVAGHGILLTVFGSGHPPVGLQVTGEPTC